MKAREASPLRGKRILLFAPAFFQYEQAIWRKMEELGAAVDFFDVRSVHTPLEKAVLKISPGAFPRKTGRYYDAILNRVGQNRYDYILLIKGDMPTVSILRAYRRAFPDAKFCLYLWDSVRNIPGIAAKFPCFDRVSSFDRTDCGRYEGMRFRPLFFSDAFAGPGEETEPRYDVSFCGTIHSDRYAVIREVERQCGRYGWRFYWFGYFQSRWVYRLKKRCKGEFRETREAQFSFQAKSAAEIAAISRQSKAVLDLQHPNQSGLTMRTLETIGIGRKLITTNAEVRRYEFYHPQNILVIDRKQVELPRAFLETPYLPLEEPVYEKYRLSAWILDVLGWDETEEGSPQGERG